MKGKVYLVGAGPADGGLLTLKGYRLLQQADVVVHDALIGLEVLGMIPPEARRIPVGKRAGNHPVPQERINEILLEEAQKGRMVVRLKGGDPFLFGRGGEELELLARHGVPFEVVPGVTSALAVPAYGGIPVTHRDYCSSVHLITAHAQGCAHAPDIDYRALVRLGGTLVFLMGVSTLPAICRGLLEAGMDPEMPAAILERGTTARQRRAVSTLAQLPQVAQGFSAPSVVIVGKVCALSERFAWAEKRPLAGLRVAVTRPRERMSALSGPLRELGAEVLELPAIRLQPISPNLQLDRALEHLEAYDWLVFTSPGGVSCFWDALKERRMDVRRLAGLRLAAIGRATAQALEARGLLVDLVPEEYSADALGRALALQGPRRALLLRAKNASPDLTARLKEAQIPYEDLPLYETAASPEAARARELVERGEVDYVAFTSASTVHSFMKGSGQGDGRGIRAACIGRTTAAAARAYGMETFVAEQATMEAMCALLQKLQEKERS